MYKFLTTFYVQDHDIGNSQMQLPLMAAVKDTTCQGGEIERIYKDDGSSTGEQTGD